MQSDYLKYYILKYFDEEKVTTVSQILHVFQGKRTPSMFYLVELNDWHHGFGQYKSINRSQLDKLIKQLQFAKYITTKEKGYVLTELGQQAFMDYFKNHYYPQKTTNFSNIKLRLPFWDRFQLFTQVFSEYSYKSSKYKPIIKHPQHQEMVRNLFQAFHTQKNEITNRWEQENLFLFNKLEDQSALVLTNLLTGHNLVGKTKNQVASYFQMTNDEFNFYFLDCLEELIYLVKNNAKKVPLITEILKQTNQETTMGLSQSTYETYQLILENLSLSQIANRRSVKINTIKEHILEIAFVFEKFPYQKFVPENIYEMINQTFDINEEITYQFIRSKNKDLEFMHFRLVELERIRSK